MSTTLNFFSIHVGNSSPSLAEKDGVIVAGYRDDDEHYDEHYDEAPDPSVNTIGSVCTDLWTVTVIEKEHLVSLLSESMEPSVAEKTVTDYIKENDVIQLKVNPGTYYAYSAGNYEDFERKSEEYALDLNGIDEPYFVLSDRQLGPSLEIQIR